MTNFEVGDLVKCMRDTPYTVPVGAYGIIRDYVINKKHPVDYYVEWLDVDFRNKTLRKGNAQTGLITYPYSIELVRKEGK